jgi:hypothetical protein
MQRVPEPVATLVRKSRRYLRHFLAAQRVTHIVEEDFIYTSFFNEALGRTPYNIYLKRWVGGRGPEGLIGR